ncbi:MAG TPA: acetyltransferase [Ruminococcaceae bacterium]|nr:acetyltransferase [Oscillospiraceae bacterium]
MSEKEKMMAGELFDFDAPELEEDFAAARQLEQIYNNTTHEQKDIRTNLLKHLFRKTGADLRIEPPFYCCFGCNIEVGEKFYANIDCILYDENTIRIGDHCLLGPRVTLCTAEHPVDAKTRIAGPENSKPITIGDNVWIGGHAFVNPGVTIGNNVVVGSGAVVTRDVPDNVLVAGVPAKIMKTLD